MQQVQARKQRMIAGALTDEEVRTARIEELKMLFRWTSLELIYLMKSLVNIIIIAMGLSVKKPNFCKVSSRCMSLG